MQSQMEQGMCAAPKLAAIRLLLNGISGTLKCSRGRRKGNSHFVDALSLPGLVLGTSAFHVHGTTTDW